MMRILCNSCEVLRNEQPKLQIQYFMIVNEIVLDNGLIYETYGLGIVTTDEGGSVLDEITILDITMSALEMERILMVLLTYTVTPVTIYDVLDDYLADPEYFLSLNIGVQGD